MKNWVHKGVERFNKNPTFWTAVMWSKIVGVF